MFESFHGWFELFLLSPLVWLIYNQWCLWLGVFLMAVAWFVAVSKE